MIRPLLFVGFVCFAVVAFTHLVEAMHWFPAMGWGLPNTPGHYLDLSSAIAGVVLLIASVILRLYINRSEKADSSA